jgi:hypothetical protein
MSIYETFIYTAYAYPSQEHQLGWVHDAWDLASEGVAEKYDLTYDMERLVCSFFSGLYHRV